MLSQYFPELISSNHAREPLKALSSLTKDTRLVGSGDRKLKMFLLIVYTVYLIMYCYFFVGVSFPSSCHLLLSSVSRYRLHNDIDECGIEHSKPVMYCMYCMYVCQCISNMQHPNNALCNTNANTPHSPSEALELSNSHSQSQC